MPEYIERDAAVSSIMQKERHDFLTDYFPDDEYAFNDGLVVAANALDEVPAADVVPVVRCGECKWSDNYGLDLMCKKHSGVTKNRFGEDIHFVEWHSKNFFCADGERMENDG